MLPCALPWEFLQTGSVHTISIPVIHQSINNIGDFDNTAGYAMDF